nr:reverse transcriptase domain-containing protein [Tanacetum cinerariifolium]
MFYHGLSEITQEVLNAATGGIFLYKTPNKAYQLLEDKVLLRLDWAKNQKTKSSLNKTVAFADEDLETKFDRLADKQSGRPSGSLPSNTQPNPRDSKAYQPPQARNEHVNAVFIISGKFYNPSDNPDDNQNNFETPINFDSDDEDDEPTSQPKTQPTKSVKETPLPKPYKPKIPYPQRLRKEKMEARYYKFLDMIRAVRINVPLVDVLARMPNYGKFLKELIRNKHKIEQISVAFLSNESSAMIQNKVPPKLEDPRTENMLVEVGKFTFPADFVILEMEEDSKVSLILRRPLLHTADAVIRVKQKQLNLGVKTKRMIFNIDSAVKHSYLNDDMCFSIDVIDVILEEDFDDLLDEGSKILYSIEEPFSKKKSFLNSMNSWQWLSMKILNLIPKNYHSRKSPSTPIIKSKHLSKSLLRILNSNPFLIIWNMYS